MLLLSGCAKHVVVEAAGSVPEPVSVPGSSPGPTAVVTYHRDLDHGPRVYLPFDSAPCQADDSANVTFLPKALWRFDAVSNAWTSVDFGTAGHWRIGCNAMVAVADIIGLDFEAGTYAIAAEVDGRLERGIIYEGPVMCNDVDLGEPAANHVMLCILSADSAEGRQVPDPALLEP